MCDANSARGHRVDPARQIAATRLTRVEGDQAHAVGDGHHLHHHLLRLSQLRAAPGSRLSQRPWRA